MEFNTSTGFRSRRSYPNLHHVSLTPLTPRFPIDDDIEPTDYFGRFSNSETEISGTRTSLRTSYLSSVSVPSTPPILSHSRSASRTRHARSRSSIRDGPSSDTNLRSRDINLPIHHHQELHKKNLGQFHPRAAAAAVNNKSDAEWMLRAGIVLASSAREEKGQSWLSKRESSTNLVSEVSCDESQSPSRHRHHHRTRSSASSRPSRSGASTPGAIYSRHSSHSRHRSRCGSRSGLTMTTMPSFSHIPSTAAVNASGSAAETGSGKRAASPMLIPDFVDERIRAEMMSLHRDRLLAGDEVENGDAEDNGSTYDYSMDETFDELDEADLQRLTRDRGFGLGSWIDRLVEWTLFGVDEWPASESSVPASTRTGATPTSTTVTFRNLTPNRAEGDEKASDTYSQGSAEEDRDNYSDADPISYTDSDSSVVLEKPGTQGGWEDMAWLLRVIKRTLL